MLRAEEITYANQNSDKAREPYEQRNRELDNDRDCAPLPPEKWANAAVGKYYRPLRSTRKESKQPTANKDTQFGRDPIGAGKEILAQVKGENG